MSAGKSHQSPSIALSSDGREFLGQVLDVEWRVDRPHETGLEAPPEVVLGQLGDRERGIAGSEQWVFWRPCLDELCECHRAPEMEGALDSLLALEAGTAHDIEGFIFKYGPFMGCIHLRAHSDCAVLSTGERSSGEWPVVWEPPEAYRNYARTFRAFLEVAAALQEGEKGELASWALITASLTEAEGYDLPEISQMIYPDINLPKDEDEWRDFSPPPQPALIREPEAFAGRVLEVGKGPLLFARALDNLMSEAPVALGFEWPQQSGSYARRPRIRLATETLGLLTYQLATAIQGNLFAICSNCLRTYAPARRPQRGRDNYCSACRDARKAAYRRRTKAASIEDAF